MKRTCAVCESKGKVKLHTQKYLLPSKRKPLVYDVVACRKCGFVYADNTPSQKQYDQYYENSSKYTYNKNVPKGLLALYQDLYPIAKDMIDQRASRKDTSQILDVGCSIGTFLHMLKQGGYRNVYGVEPSQDCSRLAKELYNIDVFPGRLSEYTTSRQFDFIIMTGVLEHISDFTSVLPSVAGLLKEDGILMTAVPDAANFSSDPLSPFDEFSIEHINYFTRRSLGNLMNKFRLKLFSSESIRTPFYDSAVLVSFYKKSQNVRTPICDHQGIKRVQKYIKASRTKLSYLDEEFKTLTKSGENIIVWGVGSLTYRLLASSNLNRVKIEFFVDSNKSLQGKLIRGRRIMSPDVFIERKQGAVFIASHIYGDEIESILKNRYHFEGKMIRMETI